MFDFKKILDFSKIKCLIKIIVNFIYFIIYYNFIKSNHFNLFLKDYFQKDSYQNLNLNFKYQNHSHFFIIHYGLIYFKNWQQNVMAYIRFIVINCIRHFHFLIYNLTNFKKNYNYFHHLKPDYFSITFI